MDYESRAFLPTTTREMQERGWDECDVIIVSGDAYVDHPSFDVARIGRVLEEAGYRVGVIDQPRWHDGSDFRALGKPRLFFAVTGGQRESQLARLTVSREPRYRDVYSPGGATGRRPDRAAIVYCNRLRECFGDVPIVMFGLECSLKRLPYYDFWRRSVRRSFLVDANADMIAYGMAERQMVQIADELASGRPLSQLRELPGTVVGLGDGDAPEAVRLPRYREVLASKKKFNEMFALYLANDDPVRGTALVQRSGSQHLRHNPPAAFPSTEELDRIYELPYTRRAHPKYDEMGGVPALGWLQFRVVTHRGCFGNCNYCDVPAYEGRSVQSRSAESIIREVRRLVEHPDFTGVIADLGGPVANLYGARCVEGRSGCEGRPCLGTEACPQLDCDPSRHLELLRAVRAIEGVEKVFVSREVRHDLLLTQAGENYLTELCHHHVDERFTLSPMHVVGEVLKAMNRPSQRTYETFLEKLKTAQNASGCPLYFHQYWMSAHPGCKNEHMVELAQYLRRNTHMGMRACDYYPSPLTVSACIYYTGYHPLTGEKVFRLDNDRDRLRQRALIYFRKPKSKRFLRETLHKVARVDLIGEGEHCLVEGETERPELRRHPGILQRNVRRQ